MRRLPLAIRPALLVACLLLGACGDRALITGDALAAPDPSGVHDGGVLSSPDHEGPVLGDPPRPPEDCSQGSAQLVGLAVTASEATYEGLSSGPCAPGMTCRDGTTSHVTIVAKAPKTPSSTAQLHFELSTAMGFPPVPGSLPRDLELAALPAGYSITAQLIWTDTCSPGAACGSSSRVLFHLSGQLLLRETPGGVVASLCLASEGAAIARLPNVPHKHF